MIANQKKLDRILASQRAILANQKAILRVRRQGLRLELSLRPAANCKLNGRITTPPA